MKSKILTSFLFTLLLISCWKAQEVIVEKVPSKNVTSDIIKSDYFSEQIKLPWKITPFTEASINPLISWTINNIYVEVWQKVVAGQTLATIDLSNSTYWVSYNNAQINFNNSVNSFDFIEESIKSDLEAASVQLENAKVSKDNTYITTEKQLELAQTQLDNIQKNVSNTKNTTTESLKNSQAMLENAKTNLDNFNKNSLLQIKSLQDQEKSMYDDIKIALDNTFITADSTLRQADLILWVTDQNKDANNSYEMFLSAKDSAPKIQSENDFSEAKSLYDNYKKNIDYSTNEKIASSLNNMINLSQKISKLCDDMIIMLDNSITSVTFTQAQLDSLKLNALWTWIVTKQSAINTIKANLITAQNWITKLNNTISTTNTSIETNTSSLQNAINIAQNQVDNINAWNTSLLDNVSWNENLTINQLENTKALVKQTRDNADNALKVAQINYDSINARLNSQRIQAKAQIDSAKWWKDLAGVWLSNTSIVAPFTWIITSKNIEVWSSVWPQNTVFQISNDDTLKVKLDVNSDNMTFFHQNDSIEIKKDNNSFSWIVISVSPSPDSLTRLYKIEILISSKTDNLNIWDYADVYLKKETKDLVWDNKKTIIIPLSSFIAFWEWKYWVFTILPDNTVKLNYVTLGRKNSSQVEILNWLNEWDKYVKEWALNLSEWDSVNIIK